MNKRIIYKDNQIIPAVALRGLTVFPGAIMHFDVGREKSIRALEHCMAHNLPVFLVTQKDIREDDPSLPDIYKYGTVSYVKQLLKIPGNNMRAMVEGSYRAEIDEYVSDEPFISVRVNAAPDTHNPRMMERTEAAARVLRDRWITYAKLSPKVGDDLNFMVETESDYSKVADFIAQNIPMPYQERQKILSERRPYGRMEAMCAFLAHEIEILSIEKEIQEKTQEGINKNQKEYYLREQIRAIQSELDEGEDAAAEAENYRRKIRALKLDAESEEKLLKEANRLARLGINNPEGSVARTWLDTCLELPWHKSTPEVISVESAEKTLEGMFYGMEKVKERILEFLAVRKLNPDLKGQVICLAGPPGTGKTSIGTAIATATGRKFARVSLGGMRDEADIRGHRKTYIGAMPGRIIQALRLAGSNNPVILLDEIDKMASDFRGDPASAMLEVLDTEQNHAFRDHYVELPVDLSNVLFIMTANDVSRIPRPLFDRMELIELGSYTDEEKLEIAKRHLLPRQLKKHGLKAANLKIADDVLRTLIYAYTHESGVRSLERELATLCRKCAKRIASGEAKSLRLTDKNMEEILGPKKFREKPDANPTEVGMVNGLAWTAVGGEILPVEINVLPGSGKIELTGNLGDVMKESCAAAMSCVRSRAVSLGIDPEFYKKNDIHIHFPEGAIPKDGPSAGITITTALVSALTGRPVPTNIAMTGEVTIRGRVLAIGGLKEKTMAAMRHGAKTVIIPKENVRDLAEIDPKVREALHFVPAETVDTVLATALLPAEGKTEEATLPEGVALPKAEPNLGESMVCSKGR